MSRPLAVVTGASSGIGEAIARRLLAADWRVAGISRRPGTIQHEGYKHIEADLSSPAALSLAAETILREEGPLEVLINNAGVGYFAPHEELSMAQIEEMVRVNLLAPLLLSKILLRAIKSSQGWIINISSFSAHERSSFGAVYAATKAGLKHFSDSLFDEVRKSGTKIVTICPDITRTPFYDDLSFAPEDDPAAAIRPESIAETVIHILSQEDGAIVSEIVMRPQRLLLKKRKRSTN
jgi:short-subunit dehydrogenase